MTDLVMLSLERWDEVWRRNQHLVDGLLRRDPDLRVLFVEPADDPVHDLSRRRTPRLGSRVRRVGDTGRLWAWRPVKLLPRRIDPHVDDRLGPRVARIAEQLGFRDPMLWINDPRLATVMTSAGWATLYDITDDWLAAERTAEERRRIADGEATLLEHAGEVVACSPELVRRKAPHRPADRHPIVLIRNAVDTSLYSRAYPRPEDLPPGRIALYAGTIHADRFDVAATAATARELGNDATVVLVGPNLLDDRATAELTAAGVAVLGPRARVELVACLLHADVLLVPHIVDAFTDSLDPIKLYEYQAAGKPVVSTRVAGFRDADDPRILLADPPRFPQTVASAIAHDDDGTDAEPTVAPDWSERVTEMGRVLARLR